MSMASHGLFCKLGMAGSVNCWGMDVMLTGSVNYWGMDVMLTGCVILRQGPPG